MKYELLKAMRAYGQTVLPYLHRPEFTVALVNDLERRFKEALQVYAMKLYHQPNVSADPLVAALYEIAECSSGVTDGAKHESDIRYARKVLEEQGYPITWGPLPEVKPSVPASYLDIKQSPEVEAAMAHAYRKISGCTPRVAL